MVQVNNNNLDTKLESQIQSSESASHPDFVSSMSFLELLLVFFRERKTIFYTSFGAAVLTAIIMLFVPNIYTAKTMIVALEDDKAGISTMMAQLGGLAGVIGVGAIGGTAKTDQYVTMLKSETVRDPIIDRYKLLNVYKEKYRTDVYKALDTRVKVRAGKRDGIISIEVSDKDPSRAAAMANEYVEELGKLTASLNMNGAGRSRQFLEERLSSAKVDVTRAGDELKAFQTKNKMVDVPEQAKVSIEGVAQLRAKLAVHEIQLAALQRQFTDASQEVKSAKISIVNLKAQISKLEGRDGTSSIPSVGSVPQLGQDYLRLIRELKVKEALVELLTKQYELTKLSESKNISPFQVLQKAKVPEKKSKPARAKIVITVTFFAFIFSLLMVFAKEVYSQMPEKDRERLKLLRARFQSLRNP